jgi:hypothetical protein
MKLISSFELQSKLSGDHEEQLQSSRAFADQQVYSQQLLYE